MIELTKPKINFQYHIDYVSDGEHKQNEWGDNVYDTTDVEITEVPTVVDLISIIVKKYEEETTRKLRAARTQEVKKAKKEAKAQNIEYVEIPKITPFKFNTLDLYILEKLLDIYVVKNYSNSTFDIDISRGYYGQELQGIYLEEKISDLIHEVLADYCNKKKSFAQVLNELLHKEYGYIHPLLEDKDFKIQTVDMDLITIPNAYIPIEHEQVEAYCKAYTEKSKNDVPQGILVAQEDGTFLLLDGLTKYQALKTVGAQTAVFIIAE